jgi:HPt (histidine-containing phosphotransfer) domain-containing protein
MPIATILLVDETAESRSFGERCLTYSDGPQVVCAASAREGLERAGQRKPDVVLLAVGLQTDLPSYVAALRRQHPKAPPNVILIAEPDVDLKALQVGEVEGIAGIITKPLDPRRLPEQVQHLFEEGRFTGQLANLRELGGEAFVVEMIDLFLEIGPKKMEEARRALAVRDTDGVRQAAHSLKSSASNLGSEVLQELAARVEKAAAEQDAGLLVPLLKELDEAYAKVKSRLEQHKAILSPIRHVATRLSEP